MKGVFTQLLSAFIALSIFSAPVIAKEICEEEGTFSGIGTSAHKQCIAEYFPEFSDYENVFSECRLIVFLTAFTHRDEAEHALGSAYRQAARDVKSCWIDREPTLEFRQARYAYTDFVAWGALADERLRDHLGSNLRGVLFMNQKIHLFVVTDAAMDEATRFLTDHAVPREAFDIGSRETEIRQMPSIAPTVRGTAGSVQVLLPVFLWSNEKACDLIPGETTLEEATRMLPAWPGHGPSATSLAPKSQRGPWVNEAVHKALDEVAYVYNPARVFLMVSFDKAGRLISAHYEVQEGQEASLWAALSELTALEEAYRDEDRVVHRGQLGPCVTVETNTALGAGTESRLAAAHYFYTCAP